jgi:hypothetical protein
VEPLSCQEVVELAPDHLEGIASAPARAPVAGALDYDADAVEPPATARALLCCSRGHEDVVLDL